MFVLPEARMRRIISFFKLALSDLGFFLCLLLPLEAKWILIIDRTNWKFRKPNINIFMLGISYKIVAFPIMFKMLNKRGNFSCEEKIELIRKYIDWFGSNTNLQGIEVREILTFSENKPLL